MNVDLLVCGFTVVFDQPSEDGRPANRRENYDWFPKFAGTLPVRVNHLPVITSSGAYDVGRVSHFTMWTARRQSRAACCAWLHGEQNSLLASSGGMVVFVSYATYCLPLRRPAGRLHPDDHPIAPG